ncbi:MAG: phosphate-starvation-inducible PsiE family protein, partial [Methanoregula sp.]
PAHQPGLEYIIRFFSLVPLAMYIIVAAMLTIVAVFSVYDAAQQIGTMIITHDFADGLVGVIYALLLTITIIVLFETVTVYFRTKHVEVRALLIAGLTGMVRHILVYNVATTDAIQMFATVALLAVLIAGIVLVKSEETPSMAF